MELPEPESPNTFELRMTELRTKHAVSMAKLDTMHKQVEVLNERATIVQKEQASLWLQTERLQEQSFNLNKRLQQLEQRVAVLDNCLQPFRDDEETYMDQD